MSLRLGLPALRAASHFTPAARSSLAPARRTLFSSAKTHATATAAPADAAAASFAEAAPRGPSAARRWGTRFAVALAIPVAFLVGAAYPPQIMLIFNPRYSPPPPSHDSKHGQALMDETERELQNLFVVAKMRDMKEWYETRPYSKFDPNKVHNSLTAGSLRGPGKLAVPPIAFAKHDESEGMIITHLGRSLCGHDGIIHGGLLATVFDESLARNALMNLPSHIGVTANLNINYRSPCMADQFIIVRTHVDKAQGRKVYVSGCMETLDGEVIAEASALFIEPKWAQFLQSSGVTEALGAPADHSGHAQVHAHPNVVHHHDHKV